MSIKIAPDSKTLRNYRIVYAIIGLNFIIIFGPNLLGFDSILTLPIFFEGLAPALIGIGTGLLLFKCLFNFNIPFILIDESKIHAEHEYWSQSFDWKKLKKVCLYKNRIELTYRQSGQTDYIKLSYLLRSRSPEIRNVLQEMCSRNDIVFEVQHPIQKTSNYYGVQINH